MKTILGIFLLVLTFSDVRAQAQTAQNTEIKVDIYMTQAGWTKQDGGYMDPQTRIIWGPEVKKTSWGEARLYCENLIFGGRDDWRLPTLEELQLAVCKTAEYPSKTACPEPRDHKKDLWVLNTKMERGLTYWAANLIGGDPYNAYYFDFDSEGQFMTKGKGDKSRARCVAIAKQSPAEPKTAAAAATGTASIGTEPLATEQGIEEFSFYIAPLIGIGGFFTTAMQVPNTVYLNGEVRVGFKIAKRFMFLFSGDTGFNVRGGTYPVMSTFSIGPEYFITDELSIFAAIGLGLITANTNALSTIVTETRAGFDWKLGATWNPFRWGDKGQYGIPLSITYTGATTKWVLGHTALFSVGFIYFN